MKQFRKTVKNVVVYLLSAAMLLTVIPQTAVLAAQTGETAGQQTGDDNTAKVSETSSASKELTPEEKLKEFVGHTPLQVVMGSILGLVIAILMHTI